MHKHLSAIIVFSLNDMDLTVS